MSALKSNTLLSRSTYLHVLSPAISLSLCLYSAQLCLASFSPAKSRFPQMMEDGHQKLLIQVLQFLLPKRQDTSLHLGTSSRAEDVHKEMRGRTREWQMASRDLCHRSQSRMEFQGGGNCPEKIRHSQGIKSSVMEEFLPRSGTRKTQQHTYLGPKYVNINITVLFLNFGAPVLSLGISIWVTVHKFVVPCNDGFT